MFRHGFIWIDVEKIQNTIKFLKNSDQPRQTDDGIRRSFTGNLKPVGSPMAAGVQIPNHHFIETPQDSPTNGVSGENLEISDVNGEESAKFVKKLSLGSIESVGETQVFDMAAEDWCCFLNDFFSAI